MPRGAARARACAEGGSSVSPSEPLLKTKRHMHMVIVLIAPTQRDAPTLCVKASYGRASGRAEPERPAPPPAAYRHHRAGANGAAPAGLTQRGRARGELYGSIYSGFTRTNPATPRAAPEAFWSSPSRPAPTARHPRARLRICKHYIIQRRDSKRDWKLVLSVYS